ncbi:hypothetical protein FUAX_19960 [Fulvitalea axinellae]|uniref:Uncharacterized protein n=1 Tax=Fulvitalea axinellae TaxID=1182444 RepID=A0AAU9CSY7_9BACT|nr:hypothetical protein FUAX_19960 [Fulvitalea axinellae]
MKSLSECGMFMPFGEISLTVEGEKTTPETVQTLSGVVITASGVEVAYSEALSETMRSPKRTYSS